MSDILKCTCCGKKAYITVDLDHEQLVKTLNLVKFVPIFQKGKGYQGDLSNKVICKSCLDGSVDYHECVECNIDGGVAFHSADVSDGLCKDHSAQYRYSFGKTK